MKKFNAYDGETVEEEKIAPLVEGVISTPIGEIKRLRTELNRRDTLGTIAVRIGIGRDYYRVPTGIYAVGNPTEDALVLVTANYKLTLDHVRRELEGLNMWILVIDTKGVNVWCAAGKGTFSTEEIIYQIKKCQLEKLVKHRQVILPQLGAPGVEAHQLKNYTGFRGVYGPVRASDIRVFLENNQVASKEMRRVTFTVKERLAVSVLEVASYIKYVSIMYILFFLLALIGGQKIIHSFITAFYNTLPYGGALVTGAFLTPLLLPYIPFRMFSVKGMVLGLILSNVVLRYPLVFHYVIDWPTLLGHGIALTTISAYLGLNFTGSSTYTSYSGVHKETIRVIPLMVVASIIATVLIVLGSLF
ncbi:hypothetical protein JOC73_002306 [Alkaliphilus hydrothermalis]|uniref:CO dehydrogenase/acetyl-CoA synthase delta subunit TIM barrel domain-containing protein n=2 Tax=Alkaliphilus hydrothermalis TaxID=1482730 RepID=A0ABS2NS87_9FIRM|nr:hypothetical protein [Alkaliphilus hydrothermalis]